MTASVQPVYGSLDKQSQRVAWTIGTMLVLFGKDCTEQYELFPIEQQKEGKPG